MTRSKHEDSGGPVGAPLGSKAASRPVTRRSRGFTSEERWDQILQVAAELFSRRGYLAVSLEDIARQVGIQKASLYHYIASKEDLLYAFELRGQELGRQSIRTVENATNRESAPRDAALVLSDFITLWIEGIGADPTIYGSLGLHVLEYLSTARRDELLAIRSQTQDWVARQVLDGMTQGHFDPNPDPRMVASTLFTMITNTAWLHRSAPDWSEIAAECATFFLYGLRPQS